MLSARSVANSCFRRPLKAHFRNEAATHSDFLGAVYNF